MIKWLITGVDGFIGSQFASFLSGDHEVIGTYLNEFSSRGQYLGLPLNILEKQKVIDTFKEVKPDCVVHFAGTKDVAWCEKNPHKAFTINTEGLRNIAEASLAINTFLIFQSSDYVFEGTRGHYSVHDECCPKTVYGQTKLKAEEVLLSMPLAWAILRSGGIYAAINPPASALGWARASLGKGEKILAYQNIYNTPTYIKDLLNAIKIIGEMRLMGIFHLSGASRESRFSFIKTFAQEFGFDPQLVHPSEYVPEVADIKPKDLSLDSKLYYQKLCVEFHDAKSGLRLASEQYKEALAK